MSLNELLLPNTPPKSWCNISVNNINVNGTTTTNDLIVTGSTSIPKVYVTKNWDPANADSVTFNGNGILTINFNTTVITAGGNSALLSISDNIVLADSIVGVSLVEYQNIPAIYNNPVMSGLTYGLPTALVYNIIDSMFQILILNNGYNDMGATDSFRLNIIIS